MTSRNRNIVIAVQLVVVIVILIFANLILNSFAKRIDLTEDHRHTPSEATMTLLDTLDSPVLIKCYLDGDMPLRYQEMRDQIQTFFAELKFAAGENLEYEFIDPTGNQELYDRFKRDGYYPFEAVDGNQTEVSAKLLLPYATVTYRGTEKVAELFKGSIYRASKTRLDVATQKVLVDLEYNLMTVVYKMTRKKNKFIGILNGHGEYGPAECGDLLNELDKFYKVLDINVRNGEAITPSCDVLLIMQPDSAFTEREKYEIDQYVMRGGKIFWMLDQQVINFDIGEQATTLTQLRDLNLDDLFLKWGFQVNYDIVQDQRCDWISLTKPNPSFPGQMQEVPWIFHPQIGLFPSYPMCRNLDLVLMRFPATIDTINRPGLYFEPFLYSGENTRTIQGKQFIDIDKYVNEPVPEQLFNAGPRIMGTVISGYFPSVFRGRQAPVDSFAPEPPKAVYLPRNVDTLAPKMVVVADGEFATGALFRGQHGKMPYDNKALVMNCIDYLSGEEVMSKVRSQAVSQRRLNPKKLEQSRLWIYALNILLPLLLITGLGFGWWFFRKRMNQG